MISNVLLYSSGLGYINRGLETFTQELYMNLYQNGDCKVTLFQGLGNINHGAKAVWAPKRNSKLYQFLPLKYLKKNSYLIENTVFSIPIIIHSYSQSDIIIHFSEAMPANILYHLRKRFGGSFKLLFSNGGPMAPKHYMRYDYVQVLTPAQKQEAIQAGYPENRLFLVPYGLNCQIFDAKLSQSEIANRRRYRGLPTDRTIIVSVGAVNASHKRMDWLIQEFSKLDSGKFFLWIVGQPEEETQSIKDLARSLLKPGSYQFDVIPYTEMPTVYNCVDYFVLCSLSEGFGRVYLEAMASELPVITHRNINTEWIMNSNNLGLIDMAKPNKLKNIITYFEQNVHIKQAQASTNKAEVTTRFDWSYLKSEYSNMYQIITDKS